MSACLHKHGNRQNIQHTLVKKATIVARGTLLTLVNQENRGNPTNIGRVDKFGVNLIPYDGNKYVPKHVYTHTHRECQKNVYTF